MVEEPEDLSIIYSGKVIAKNTIYNLLGYGIPMIFAIVLIPPLIKGLGDERFGILNLAWIVIGYFSFFDFGIGRSLTKITAEKIGLNQTGQIPGLFWTSLFLMLTISLIISIGLIFFIPSLVNYFNISQNMQLETVDTFYALVVAIPIVSTTAAVRGFLEAYQKFGIINIMRVFLGIFTFLGPLLCLIITNSLFWVVVFLIFIRIVIWILYLFQCFNINKNIKSEFKIDFKLIVPVFKFSMWITIANVIGPLILYTDRFLIGTLVSAKAITYYATPYEVVTKLLLIPSSLVGVLFPVFSASFFSNPDLSKKLFLRGTKFIFLIVYPAVLLIVVFSYEGMGLWLGEKFAINSALVLQFLTIGVLFNSIAYIPFNYFQGVGKPEIPAIVNLIEFPFYLLFMWISIKQWGIDGAAFVWLSRILIDTTILFFISQKIFGIRIESKISIFSLLIMMVGLIIPFFLSEVLSKIVFVIPSLFIFVIMAWKYFVSIEEKNFLLMKMKLKIK